MDAERIRKMAEIMEKEEIARALEVPLAVVESVLAGELEEIGPHTQVKVIEKPKFVRSRVIGILSPFWEAFRMMFSLAKEASRRDNVPSLLIDLSELGVMEAVVPKPKDFYYFTTASYKYSKDVGPSCVEVSKNIYAMFACASLEDNLQLTPEELVSLVKGAAEIAGYVWVFFPMNFEKWKLLAEVCDKILFYLQGDSVTALVNRILSRINSSKIVFVSDNYQILAQAKRIASSTGRQIHGVLFRENDPEEVLQFLGISSAKEGFFSKLLKTQMDKWR